MKKNIAKVLLSFGLLLSFSSGNIVANASLPMSQSIKIDREYALKDAKIHRLDNTEKVAYSTSNSNSNSSSTSNANSNSSSTSNTSNAGGEVVKPAVKAYEVNNKPNRVVVTIKNDPATTRAFNWFTSENFDSKVLVSEKEDMSNPVEFKAEASDKVSHYVERDEKGFFIFQLVEKESGKVIKYFTDEGKTPGEWDQNFEITDKEKQAIKIDVTKVNEVAYKAEATGLKANTTYYYQLGSEAGGMSEVGTFKTGSDKNDAFSFLHYTDTQNAYWNQNLIDEAAFGADTIKKALALDKDASFVMHTGDIVEIAEVEDEWVDLFEKSKESFMKTTLATAPGNHDEYGLNYDERFLNKYTDHVNVPNAGGKDDGGTYYSYDFNGVHFIVLNTNDYKNEEKKAVGKEQLEWLKKDVEEARSKGAKWVILSYHKPIYSKSYHSLQDTDVQNVKEELMKLTDELNIDLVLQGHDHVISRTKSLVYAPESKFFAKVSEEAEKKDGWDYLLNPQGTTFVLPNTGGTKAYDDIYSKGLDHVKKVRPKLDWLTEELLAEYNGLFAYGLQPQKSKAFEKSHSNFRDSKVQNFARYIVNENSIKVELYQIEGELSEAREPKLVDSFTIEKK